MLILDEPLEAYHDNPAVSHSRLRDFDEKGPKYYFLRWIQQALERPSTSALRVGRAFETYLFEPQIFDQWFTVKPEDYNGKKNEWKDWAKAQELSGKTVISRKEHASFEWMAKGVRACVKARELLEAGISQPTWRIDWPGVPGLQSRPDWGNVDGCDASGGRPYTLDLKTCASLAKMRSGRAIVDHGYYTQAGVARIASELEDAVHYLLVVEKPIPHRAMVLELSHDFVALGESWALGQLEAVAGHYTTDRWPLTTVDHEVVEPPQWLLRVADEPEGDGYGEDEADEPSDEADDYEQEEAAP